MDLPFLARLDLQQDADERAIRRAYARELKRIDQESDPEGFQSLRDAYDRALNWARRSTTAAAPPAPAPEPATAPAPAPDTAPAPARLPDDAELAGAVFDDFRRHCLTIPDERPALPQAPWVRELHRSLEDPRLIGIQARGIFESHIAQLLASGWQTGHEHLLVAAIKVFGWEQDRRRLLGLGRAGGIIDAAIQELAAYEMQAPAARNDQHRVMDRLRDARAPRMRELVANAAPLELLVTRFPNWLALTSSAPNIQAWRQRNAELPGWKRRLAVASLVTASEPSARKQFIQTWLNLMAFIVLAACLAMCQNKKAPQPAAPKPPLGLNAMAEGVVFLNAGNYPAAVTRFAQAIRDNRNNALAYAYHATALIMNGDEYNAQRDLDTAEKINPREPQIQRARGMLAKKRKRYDEAIAAFSKSLQLQPDHPYTLTQRAESYLGKGDYAQALQDTSQLLALKKGDGAGTHMLRAFILQKQEQRAEAAKEIEAALAARPTDAQLYQSAAGFYVEWQQRDKAIAVLGRGVQAAPDAALYLQRARLHAKGNNMAAALRDLDSTLQLDPERIDAIRLRAEITFNSGRWQDAVAGLGQSLAQHTFDSHNETALRTLRGIMYQKKNQLPAAAQDFDAARKAAKSAADLSAMCDLMVANNAALGTALEICDASLARASANAQTLEHKGMALLLLRRYDEAITVFSTAIGYGDAASSWYGRAVARQRSGDVTGSRADAEQARKRSGGAAAAYERAGLTLSRS